MQLSVRSRVLTAVAALLLLALFFVPLWRIQLQAPQYPEGLGLLIQVNTITGLAPTDLQNINELNHYIGMKAIEPEAVPVLRYMPWVLGALVLFGLAAAAAGRRAVLVSWVAVFGFAGIAGLTEFYLWSYDYGHNLASDAVIKVPGMTYQPPLIGSKQLLNFTASSWPAVGGWLAGGAFMLAIVALWPLGRRGHARTAPVLATARAAIALVVTLLLVSACRSSDPSPIAYGRADCDVCRMRISDNRFGGELVTRTGKVRQFDSIECLANYSVSTTTDVRSAWVSDFDRPGTLIPTATALFVRRTGPSAGMGANLLAVAARSDLASVKSRFGVAPLSWMDIRSLATRGALRALETRGSSSGA